MTRFSVAFVLVAGLVAAIHSTAVAQEEKTDIYALILALSDIEEATKLMTIYEVRLPAKKHVRESGPE